jgi:hypothetical protein
MTSPLIQAAALLLILIFAAADRIVGGAGKRSVGMALAVLGGGFLGYVAAGWPLASAGAVWMLYRSLPFSGGSAAPTTGRERAAALIRHLPVFLVFVPALWAHASDLLRLAACLALAVAAAFTLAVWYGGALIKAREAGRPIGNQNQAVEILRGAAFGGALAVWVLV